ncbi:MAG: universal stress protein [Bacteroidota bacterium]
MRKILIPTDFSENAMNAIRYALEVFKFDTSQFVVMNAFADDVYENTREMPRAFFEEYKQKVEEATDRQLQKVVAKMLEISPNPKHEYSHVSVFDSLVDAANDLANSENMDVIVMGTKGKTDDRDITFGSQTLQVIKYVKCPVLLVPAGYHNGPLKNILFPTDYMVPYKRRELKLVSTVAKNFGSKIHLLHLSKAKDLTHRKLDNRSFLECTMDENMVSFIDIPGEDITGAIHSQITEQNPDLLVMVNSRHSYMESLLYRSTIEKIGLHIKIPFLVLQNLPR